jgi:DeoR/GlpR family transcriptional regulator of sugar metabolism
LENATKSFLLLDHSKIGVKASYRLASLKDIDYIMSDVPVPEDWKIEEINRNKWISCQ